MSLSPFPFDQEYEGVPTNTQTNSKAFNNVMAALKTSSDVSLSDDEVDVVSKFHDNKSLYDTNPDYANESVVYDYSKKISATLSDMAADPAYKFTPQDAIQTHKDLIGNISANKDNAAIEAGLEALNIPPEKMSDFLIQKKLNELHGNDVGFLSNASDFLGATIPFRTRFDLAEAGGSAISNTEFENMVLYYRTEKDAAKKTQLAKAIIARIDEWSDNNTLKTEYLSQFLSGTDPNDYITANTTFDALEATPIGIAGDIASFGKAISRTNSLARLTAEAGNKEAAGILNTASILDKSVADGNGTSTVTAALNTMGARLETLFPEAQDGIANESVRALAGRLKTDLQDYQKSLIDNLGVLDEAPTPTTLSPKDYDAAVAMKKQELVREVNSIPGPNLPKIDIEDVVEVGRGSGKFKLKVNIKPSHSSGIDGVVDDVVTGVRTTKGSFRYDVAGKMISRESGNSSTALKTSKTISAKLDDAARSILSVAHKAVKMDDGSYALYKLGENKRYSKTPDATITPESDAVAGNTLISLGDTKYLGKGKQSFTRMEDVGDIQDFSRSTPPAGQEFSRTVDAYVADGDVQGFDIDNMKVPGLGAKTVYSPMRALENMTSVRGETINHLGEAFELQVSSAENIAHHLQRAYKSARGSISIMDRSGRKQLQKLLEDGTRANNGQGVVFSASELYAKSVPENVMKAYYRIQTLNEATATLRGWLRFKEWSFKGYKQLRLSDNAFHVVDVADTPQGASNVIRLWKDRQVGLDGKKGVGTKEISIYSMDMKTSVTEGQANNLIKSGQYKLVSLQSDPIKIKGVGSVELAIVSKSSISDLTFNPNIFKQLDGYSPIIRREAYYAVIENVVEKVNGIERISKRVHTLSPSLSMSETAVKKAEALATSKGEKTVFGDTKKRFELIKPSDRGAKFIDDTEEGKLFYGHRATHEFAKLAQADDIEDPIKALGANLNQLSKAMSMANLRVELSRRFEQSAKVLKGNDKYSLSRPITETSDAGKKLEYIRKYIFSLLSVPDRNTEAWSTTTRHLAEWADNRLGNNYLSRKLMGVSQVDPIVTLKSTAFHSLLGWFNPSQLFVQAMNMTIAASMHPILTVKNAPKSIALMIGLNRDNPSLIRHIAKTTLLDPDEMEDLHKQFLRYGVRDGIRTNADIEASYHGFGTTGDAFKWAADKGLVFYRQGELSGRTVAYTVARENYMNKAGKTWKELTNTDHDNIYTAFQNISLNLSTANKTPFQYGVQSLPTQFWHVQTKYLELLMGKKFTFAEKARLVTFQAALFGAAGVPFGNKLAEWWANEHKDEQGNYAGSLDPDVIKQGMFSLLFDGELALAERAGLGNSIEDWYKMLLEDSNKTMLETIMGASGTLFKRGGEAVKFTLAFSSPEDDASPAEFKDYMFSWASIVSTANNGVKGYEMMQHNDRRNSKGAVLYEDPSVTEIYGKMAGFESQRYIDLYDGLADIYARRDWIDAKVKHFMDYWKKTNRDRNINSPEAMDDFVRYVQAASYSVSNEYDRNEIQKKLLALVLNSKDKEMFVFKEYVKAKSSEEINILHADEAIKRMYEEK